MSSVLMVVVAAGAAPGLAHAGTRPVTPEFFGVQDDRVGAFDAQAWGSARVWAAWCTVQPTAQTDVATAAGKKLGRAFSTYSQGGVTRLTVSLGHPSAWVFGNHPRAQSRRKTHVWFCEQSAANTSFPTAASLRSGPVHDAYSKYVAAVISAAQPYLRANPANRLVLQAWNEPNLRNGGTVDRKIPGAARSWSAASSSLRQQERIIRRVAQARIPGRFEITSPSLYGKATALNTRYFRHQARSRTIDSISLNFYTLRQRSVNRSIALWRKKAAVAKGLVTRHRSLRTVPIWLTETNHNLLNVRNNSSNVDGLWAREVNQRRLVQVTTMEALRQGFAGLQWYQGSATQTAVNTRPGTPATLASKALRAELLGRTLGRCTTRRGVTTCTMTPRAGDTGIRVRWSASGKSGVTILR